MEKKLDESPINWMKIGKNERKKNIMRDSSSFSNCQALSLNLSCTLLQGRSWGQHRRLNDRLEDHEDFFAVYVSSVGTPVFPQNVVLAWAPNPAWSLESLGSTTPGPQDAGSSPPGFYKIILDF